MDRTDVCDGVAARLFEAEQKVDDAFAALANLAGYLPVARRDAQLALKVGGAAITKIAAAMTEIAQARATIVSAHDDFAVVQRALGVRVTAIGGGEKPNPQSTARLHAIDAA